MGINIITTPKSKDKISPLHPNYKGVFGFGGHNEATETLENSDLIITFNNRFLELDTNQWSDIALNSNLIHIDNNYRNFSFSYIAKDHLYTDINSFLNFLINSLNLDNDINVRYNDFISINTEISEQNHLINPSYLFPFLYKNIKENSRYIIDAGNSWAWSIHYMHLYKKSKYMITMNMGSMAWSLGASIGVSLNLKNQKTVVFCGDGSYLMSSSEISTAVEYNLNTVYVILNDSNLGMVKHGQRLGEANPIDFNLPSTDFSKIAEGLGCYSIRIKNLHELQMLDFDMINNYKGPILRLKTKSARYFIAESMSLDIIINDEAIPPMGERVKGLSLGN